MNLEEEAKLQAHENEFGSKGPDSEYPDVSAPEVKLAQSIRIDDFANVSSISKKPNKVDLRDKRSAVVLPTIEQAPNILSRSKVSLQLPTKRGTDNLSHISHAAHGQAQESKLMPKGERKSSELLPQDILKRELEQRNDQPLCVCALI